MATIPFVKDPSSPKIYDSRTGEWIQNEQEFFNRAAQAGLPSSKFQQGVNFKVGTADEITKFGQAKPVSAPATQVGQTPAQTQTGLPAPSLTAPSPAPIDTSKTVSDFITEQNKQSADMFTSLQKSMTDSQAALQKQQQDFMTQFGETTNKELVTKFEETQTQQKQAMQAYYDQQAKFLQDLQNQPSAVDQLKQFREQQGMPQMEAEIAKMDQAVLDVEGLLTNLSADIKKRTEGLPVTEAAARRLQAMEGAPIEKQLNELIRSRQRVAAGYEQKRAAVQEFASAAERDIARKREASGFGLQFAKEGAAFEGDLATQSFNMFSNLQDRLLKVGEAGLGFAQTSAEFSQNLAKVGFDMFSQMQSRQLTGYTADKENELAKLKVLADLNEKETQRKFELEKQEQSFQNDLILKQVENEMKNANPDYNFKTVEDEVGNVTMIQTDKKTGKSTMTNLGNIGAPSKTSGQNIPINTTELSNEQLLQAQTLSSELFGKIVGSKAENVQRITDLMKEGKNINQIRDFLKTGRFSTGFSGVMRDAAESIAINLTDKQSGAFLDSIDRSIEEKNTQRVKSLLTKTAIDSFGVEESKKVRGTQRTLQFINEIETDLVTYQNNNGAMSVFEGSSEKIINKAGEVKNVELRRIAVKIAKSIQEYRRSMTGVAFTPPEAKEYRDIFPSISNAKNLNTATIKGLREAMQGDLNFYMEDRMGKDAYNNIFQQPEVAMEDYLKKLGL